MWQRRLESMNFEKLCFNAIDTGRSILVDGLPGIIKHRYKEGTEKAYKEAIRRAEGCRKANSCRGSAKSSKLAARAFARAGGGKASLTLTGCKSLSLIGNCVGLGMDATELYDSHRSGEMADAGAAGGRIVLNGGLITLAACGVKIAGGPVVWGTVIFGHGAVFVIESITEARRVSAVNSASKETCAFLLGHFNRNRQQMGTWCR